MDANATPVNNSPAEAAATTTNDIAAGTASSKIGNVIKKPKRPLSAFNLFYRFKRQKVLDALSTGTIAKCDIEDHITRLVKASPGLEDRPTDDAPEDEGSPPDASLNDIRRSNIRSDLVDNLMPRDTRDRQHRTNQSAMNGSMSFLELGKLMNTSWKACDDFARTVFHELAEEGRQAYRLRLKEYNEYAARMGLPKEETKAAKKKKKSSSKKNKRKADDDDDDEDSDDNYGGTNNNFNGREPASLLDLLSRGGSTSGVDNALLLRMAQEGGLRTISSEMSGSPSTQFMGGGNHHHHNEDFLRNRVRELEGQLAAERLRARVQELEGALARQKTVEEQLRSHLDVLAHNNGAGSLPPGEQQGMGGGHQGMGGQQGMAGSGGGGNNPTSSGGGHQQGDGLWSLVSASMIHPSSRYQERAAMLSRMVAANNGNGPNSSSNSNFQQGMNGGGNFTYPNPTLPQGMMGMGGRGMQQQGIPAADESNKKQRHV